MTVYVDTLRAYRRGQSSVQWCHMMTDGPVGELHVMARKIGAKTAWFQNHPSHPHYDLMERKRLLAISFGAVEVTTEEMVKRCSTLFRSRKDR